MDELASNPRIQSLRDRLDEIDVKIVRTLNERARLLHDLATVKGEAGAQLFDPQREEEILQRVAEENPGPIYDSTMREIFAVIMHRIRDIEASHWDCPELGFREWLLSAARWALGALLESLFGNFLRAVVSSFNRSDVVTILVTARTHKNTHYPAKKRKEAHKRAS
jgi:chorismate mutase